MNSNIALKKANMNPIAIFFLNIVSASNLELILRLHFVFTKNQNYWKLLINCSSHISRKYVCNLVDSEEHNVCCHVHGIFECYTLAGTATMNYSGQGRLLLNITRRHRQWPWWSPFSNPNNPLSKNSAASG